MNGFPIKFTRLLEKTNMSRFEKDVIQSRFVNIVKHTEMQYIKVRILFLGLIQLITIAGVLIAALTPLEQVSWISSTGSMVIFWIIWSLAIILTLANKWLYSFNIHKKYVLNIIVLEKLYSEGWSFLAGVGHYKGVVGHEKYLMFCARIEKIKLKSIESIPEIESNNAMNDLLATGQAEGTAEDTAEETEDNAKDETKDNKHHHIKEYIQRKKNHKSKKIRLDSKPADAPVNPNLVVDSTHDNVANSTDIVVDIAS